MRKDLKKTGLFLAFFVCCTGAMQAQNIISVPDPHFLSKLLALGVDTDLDGQISFQEATTFQGTALPNPYDPEWGMPWWDYTLDVHGTPGAADNISDLTGIEYFTSIQTINCSYNNLTTLTVNHTLSALDCSYNQITRLDLSNRYNLSNLNCSNNNLNQLNIVGTDQLFYLDASANPNLACIQYGNHPIGVSYNTVGLSTWYIDGISYFAVDCAYPGATPPQAPVAAAQSFCQGKKIADLVATGTNLKWYASAIGGFEIASNTVLTTSTYYVSQTVNGTESARTAVAVTITTTPALASQSYFVNGGIALSTVPGYGSSYSVYASANAPTALPSSTVLTAGPYYATQTQNGCESLRSLVTVVVYSLTAVNSPACGSRLTAISAPISATAVANATNYLFEVTGNGSTQTFYSNTNSFNLTQLPGGIVYNTAYSIRVAAGFSGQYGAFGTACTITTPALANTTQVIASQCGAILASMNTPIYSGQIVGAQAYRFEFTTGGVSRTLDNTTNSVQISNLAGGPAFGTAYSVRVAAQVAGSWQAFGTACTVTTPAASTQIRTNQCGTTLSSKWNVVYCAAVTGATAYRFEWTNGGTVLTFNSTTSNMQLGNYTGWALNTTYSVRVAVQFGGTWQAYGSACNITSPATFARLNAGETVSLNVKAVPNPFETEYVLMAQGGNQNPVQVAVYDMLGKQVEQFSVEANELENHSLGSNYTSGIYNVMISQGDEQQVVRIVKK